MLALGVVTVEATGVSRLPFHAKVGQYVLKCSLSVAILQVSILRFVFYGGYHLALSGPCSGTQKCRTRQCISRGALLATCRPFDAATFGLDALTKSLFVRVDKRFGRDRRAPQTEPS